MIATLTDLLFGCRHKSYTFPITREVRAENGWRTKNCYVVCLECGAEFAYDWQAMRMGARHKSYTQQLKTEARRIYDDIRTAGPRRQQPLQKNVLTIIERKKA